METPDGVLVRQAQAGDVAAFESLVQRYYPICLRFAWRQLGNREDAEEVVQDALVRAWRSIGGCQDPNRFRGWIFTIVINRCRTLSAHNRRRFLLFNQWREREAPIAVAPAEAGRTSGDRELERVLAQLSPALREAFLLKHVEELTYEEMARVTGASVSALKMRVKRAGEALARALEERQNV